MAIDNTELNAFTLSTPDEALQQRIDDVISTGIGFALQNTAGITAIQMMQLEDIAKGMAAEGLESDALALTQFALTSFNVFLLSEELDVRGTFETIERVKPTLTFHEISEDGTLALKTDHGSELTGSALETAIANEAVMVEHINGVLAENPRLAEIYAGKVRIADTFDEDSYQSSGPTEHALDAFSFLVTDPTSNEDFLKFAAAQDDVSTRALDAYAHIGNPDNPAFLELAEAAYNAEHGENAWEESIGSRLQGLQTAAAMSQGAYTVTAEDAARTLTTQLIRYGLQNESITQDPEFLKAAEADWNALNAPKTWAEHVAERRADVEADASSWSVTDLWDGDASEKLANFDTDMAAELSAWARDGNIRTAERLHETGVDNLWKNEDFLEAAEKNFNAIHAHTTDGPKTWTEYVAKEQQEKRELIEMQISARLGGRTLESLEEQVARAKEEGRELLVIGDTLDAIHRLQAELETLTSEETSNKMLAEWGLGHIQSIQGNLDFSKAAAFGLDPDVFKGLDAQNLLADDTIEDRTTRIGAAYLNAAEIVYNARKGDGAWAIHVHEQGWDAEEADRQLAAEGESLVGWMLEDNVTTALYNYFDATDEAKVAVLYLQQLHAYKENSWGDLGNAILRGTVDPTMWVGIASGGTALSARVAAQLAMRSAGKHLLSRAMMSKTASVAIGASIGGALEGAITEGALVYGQQQTGIDTGVRAEYDFRSIMMSAGMGAAFGAGLGGAIGTAGHILARRIDFAGVSRSLAKADLGNRSVSFTQFEALIARAKEAADVVNNAAEPTPEQLKAFTDVTEEIMYFDTSGMSGGELAYARVTHETMLYNISDIADDLGIEIKNPDAIAALNNTATTPDAAPVETTLSTDIETAAPAVETTAPADISPTILADADTAAPDLIANADTAPTNRVAPEQLETPVSETAATVDVTTADPVIRAPEAEAPAVEGDNVVTFSPASPVAPANITSGAFTPWLSDPRIAAAPFDDMGGWSRGSRPVFSPADSNRGATPPNFSKEIQTTLIDFIKHHRIDPSAQNYTDLGFKIEALRTRINDATLPDGQRRNLLEELEEVDRVSSDLDAWEAIVPTETRTAPKPPQERDPIRRPDLERDYAEQPDLPTLTEAQIKAEKQAAGFMTEATRLINAAARNMEDAGARERLEIKETLNDAIEALEGTITRARLLKDHVDGPSIATTLINDINALRNDALNLEVTPIRTTRRAFPKDETTPPKDETTPPKDETVPPKDDGPSAAEVAASKQAMVRTEEGVAAANERLKNGLTAIYASIDGDSRTDAEALVRAFYKEIEDVKTAEQGKIIEGDLDAFNRALTDHEYKPTADETLADVLQIISDTRAAERNLINDTSPNTWANDLDAKFKRDPYSDAERSLNADEIGEIDPELPFRRIRKDVDPALDQSTDPILGAIVTKIVKNEAGEEVEVIVSGTYRTLADFQAGLEDGTKNFVEAMQAASKLTDPTAKARAIEKATKAYEATLDKMDAATDHLSEEWELNTTGDPDKMLSQDGTLVLRNKTRRDYAGGYKEGERPHVTAIQKIGVQESIVDARMMINDFTDMVEKPDGDNLLEAFLVGVAQRVNKSQSPDEQFDTLIASGWTYTKGEALPEYDSDAAYEGFEIGHVSERAKIRFGHELAEAAHAFTVGHRFSSRPKNPNVENKNSTKAEPIVRDLNDSEKFKEYRGAFANGAEAIDDVVGAKQFSDLLYFLERGAKSIPALKDGSPTDPFRDPELLLKILVEERWNGQPLTPYQIGVLKRLHVEADKIARDNPEDQLEPLALGIFGEDSQDMGNTDLSGRARRSIAAIEDINHDLLNGRNNDGAGKVKFSAAARKVYSAVKTRFWLDKVRDYYFRLKDIDYEATATNRLTKPVGWRLEIPKGEDNAGGLRFPLRSFFGKGPKLIPLPTKGTIARAYGRWLTPVEGTVMALKTLPNDSSILMGRLGKYARTDQGTRLVRWGGHTAWHAGLGAGTYYGGTAALHALSFTTPAGLLFQGTGALASVQAAVLGNGFDWGYSSYALDAARGDYVPQPAAPTTEAAASPETPDAAPDPALVDSEEYEAIDKWVNRQYIASLSPTAPSTALTALQLPINPPGWADHKEYLADVKLRMAHLLKHNNAVYNWDPADQTFDFTKLWNDAREEIDPKTREANIDAALFAHYKGFNSALTRQSLNNNATFNRVKALLVADTGRFPILDVTTNMPFNPAAGHNRALFTSEVDRRIASLQPAATAARMQAALTAYAAIPGITATPAVQQRAAEIIALKEVNGEFIDLASLSPADKQTLLNDTLAAVEQEIAAAERETAARYGFNTWMATNTPDGFDELPAASQDILENSVVIALKDLSGTSFDNDTLRNQGNAAMNAARHSAITQAMTNFAKADLNKDGLVDDKDKAIAQQNNVTGTDLSVDWTSTKASLSNLFNDITDMDNNGYSEFIETDLGRSISGTVQLAGGALADLAGNLNATQDGQKTIGIGAGILAALIAPSLAKQIPILKHFANLPIIGGLGIAVFSFFMMTKAANSYFTGSSIFGGGDGEGEGANGGNGEAQGGGGHIQRGEGFRVRTQPHTGDIPQIATLERDLDGDGVDEIINFFNTDGDDKWAAQIVSADGSETYAVPEVLTRDQMQGLMNFTSPSAVSSEATLKPGQTIGFEFTDHDASGNPTKSTLTVNGTAFEQGVHLIDDGLVDKSDLEIMER